MSSNVKFDCRSYLKATSLRSSCVTHLKRMFSVTRPDFSGVPLMWLYNTFPTHRFLSQTISIKASCISHYAAFEFQFILQDAPKCDITRWNTAVYRWWNVISMHTFWNVNCLHNKTLGLINYVYVTQKRSVTNVSFSKLKYNKGLRCRPHKRRRSIRIHGFCWFDAFGSNFYLISIKHKLR